MTCEVITGLREERSPEFWRDLVSHPAVAHVVEGMGEDISAVICRETVLPMATENGGYLFIRLELLGRVYDIHAAYKPEGRGREAGQALKACMDAIPADLFIATETANPMSRPPKSFGFREASEWRESEFGPIRTWAVTRKGWQSSPAHRKAH